MARMYWERDIDPTALEGKRVAVVGYGSQGRGQALNLRDSGVDVVVGVRSGGPTWKQAEGEGWTPRPVAEAVDGADVICLLVPDMAQPGVFAGDVRPAMREGAAVLFSHGFNVHFGRIEIPETSDIVMVAPKGPGGLVRRQYEQGSGVPCLIAVQRDATGGAKRTALAYAGAVGGARAGVIETTFAEETETDLFGEQAVLCGGVTSLITAGFDTLVEAGYEPEVAYFECLHELKLIVDLIYEGGFARMHEYVSETAQYGDHSRGHRVVDEGTKARMREILEEIRSGKFAREWAAEHDAGLKNYRKMQREDAEHPIERVGRELRRHFSWIGGGSAPAGKRADRPVGATS